MSQTLFQILNSNCNLLKKLYSFFSTESVAFNRFEKKLTFFTYVFLFLSSSDSLEKSKIPNPAASHAYNILMFMYKLNEITNHSDFRFDEFSFKFKKLKIQKISFLLLFWDRRKLRVSSSQ